MKKLKISMKNQEVKIISFLLTENLHTDIKYYENLK